MSKIAIIGPYPPPFGGVSIHIKRLSQLLEENSIQYEIIDDSKISNKNIKNYKNTNYKKLLLELIFKKKSYDILHFNSRNWNFIFMILILNRLKSYKIVLTLHSFRENLDEKDIKTIIIKKVLRKVDHIIAVSNEIQKKLIDFDIDKNKIEVIPAFIPPILNQDKIKNIKNKYFNEHIYTIVSNASKIEFYNEQDLYGLDMCIDISDILKREGFKFKFLFVLSEVNNIEYYEKIISVIRKKNLQNVFEVIISNEEFSYFLASANMFIRATNTDGDSVSIRESLYLEKVTIASDVVARPYGVHIFKNRNINSLSEIVKDKILKSDNLIKYKNEDYKQILNIFNQYLKNR